MAAMLIKMEYNRVIISATSEEEAKRILQMLTEKKLVAGGLIIDGLSNYWWEGKIVEKIYFNLLCFTISENKEKIIEEVEKVHSDKCPIIAFMKMDGNQKFLDWVRESVKY